MTAKRRPGRFVPQGCDAFSDSEIDLLHGIKYSYYMEVGRLIENKYGFVVQEDFQDLEVVTNACLDSLSKTVADRVFKNNGIMPS